MKFITQADVRKTNIPPSSLALWWLGQSGFLIQSSGGTVVALDPYLSNSLKALGEEVGVAMDRMVPAPLPSSELAGIDAYLMTHSHQDHLDPDTLAGYRSAGGQGPYIAPAETVEVLTTIGVPEGQIRMVWPNKEVSIGDLTIRATFCVPFGGDDLTHVGYLIRVKGGPTVYFTGDTGFHDVIADSVRDHKPDILVTVINGCYRNLGPREAARLAKLLDVKIVIPCHYDLFEDNSQPPQMLRTNLKIEGIGERYRLLEHGVPYLFPETAS